MKTAQTNWLTNPTWDAIFIMGGLWLLPVVAVCSFLPDTFLLLSLVLTSILWLSHRVATFFTIFCTPAYQSLIKSEPARFILIPSLVLLLSVAFAVYPLPPSPLLRLQVMGTIFLLFNTYHFGVQHFGVLTIYRLKAAQQLALNVRERERTLCLLLGGVLVLIGQLLHGADVVRESLLYTTIPATLSSIVRIAGIAAVLCGGAILIRDEVQASVTSFPKLLYKTALIAQALAAFILPALPFLILWAVQHWLVSVGLGLHMTGTSARHGVAPGTNLWWRSWSVINRHPMLAAAVLAGFSAIFTPLLLLPTKVVSGATSGTELPNLIEWFRHHETATLVLIGLNFGTVFCHFLYDRAVFRFSHAETRATSGKLLFS